jgi:DNA invertase Pin-like site-specific DNA recombinase
MFIDKASGKNADRPGLKRMIAYIRQGDTVIVESISRFAQYTTDLMIMQNNDHAKNGTNLGGFLL